MKYVQGYYWELEQQQLEEGSSSGAGSGDTAGDYENSAEINRNYNDSPAENEGGPVTVLVSGICPSNAVWSGAAFILKSKCYNIIAKYFY